MNGRLRALVAFSLLALIAITAAGCSRSPEVTKQHYFASGNRYFERKKFREAIVEYRNAIKIDPRFGEARLKLAASYLQTGDIGNSLREQVRAADLLPANNDAQIEAGNLLLLTGRFEDAKARASRVLESDASSVDAQILLGNALAGLKDFDGAISEVEEALRLDPDRVSTYASLGTLQLAHGNRQAAEDTFKRAVKKHASSVPARLALANFYWTVGQVREAEQLLAAVAAGAPDDARANRAFANFLLSTKRVAEAERYLVALTRVDPSPGARLTLADYYVAAGRPGDAVPLLKSIGPADNLAGAAQIRLAGIDVRAKRFSEAERIVDDVLSGNSSDTEALLLKATILLGRGKIDDAAKYVKTAAESNPRSARAQFALGKLALMQRRPDDARKAFTETVRLNPRAADAQTELARIHLAEGAVDTGVDFAGQAVKNDPSSLEARVVLARAFVAKKDLPRAQEILTELTAANPKSAAARTQLGFVLAFRGDRAAAARAFEEALTLDPDHLDATAGLVSLDLTTRQFEQARSRVAARVARTPRDSNVLLLAGKTYVAVGDAKSAEEAMRKAIELDPGNLAAYEALGGLYVRANRLPEALQEFEALVARQASPVAALTMMGMIQEGLKRTGDARKTYEKALEFDRNAPVAANNLAWIYLQAGESLDLALQLGKTAKAGLPRQSQVADTLGWIYHRKGLTSLAVRELQEAVDREPGNPLYHYHLGIVFAASGNRERAKRSLETALRLKPDFDGAQEASRVLSTL
jgi:putative PEP-CTERM system TPR-repeat lipoprotein